MCIQTEDLQASAGFQSRQLFANTCQITASVIVYCVYFAPGTAKSYFS